MRPTLLWILTLAAVATAVGSERSRQIVVCAPGYPGTTLQAQPTMDALARGIERTAGWHEGRLTAVYHPTVEGGLEALASDTATIAVVPLPFYLEFRHRLELTPLAQAIVAEADGEVWTLVARKGALPRPEALDGWSIASMSGYSSGFVRRVALAGWGAMPSSAVVRFSGSVLAELRRAAEGEKVAVLLDGSQAVALDSLPFADQLERVTRSRPLSSSLVCAVGDRLGGETGTTVARALRSLDGDEAGRELLRSLRLRRFDDVEADALAVVERAFDAEPGGGR